MSAFRFNCNAVARPNRVTSSSLVLNTRTPCVTDTCVIGYHLCCFHLIHRDDHLLLVVFSFNPRCMHVSLPTFTLFTPIRDKFAFTLRFKVVPTVPDQLQKKKTAIQVIVVIQISKNTRQCTSQSPPDDSVWMIHNLDD